MLRNKTHQTGFTLIELMVAIAIMAILVALAIPRYQAYVIRNNRVAVQAEMMQIASLMELRKAQFLNYTMTQSTSSARLAALGRSDRFPAVTTQPQLYTLTLNVATNGLTWDLRAVPTGRQAMGNDGALALDSQGRQCWSRGSNSGCSSEADRNNANNAWGTNNR